MGRPRDCFLNKEFAMLKIALSVAFASVASLGFTAQALAHAHLDSSTPAADATVTSPSELDLKFSEELNLKFTGIKLAGPHASEVKLGEPTLMDGDKTLMVPISGTVPGGTYTVNWHALSQDGHKTQGSFTFTVKP
jgi:methionine-rich copper-binding protein CopC